MRIVLFALTNIGVLVVLSVVARVLGLDQMLGRSGGMTGLLVMAGIMGMAGSFISLLMSKSMAKRSTRARVIEEPATEEEAWLLSTVRRLAKDADIGMPEVAIFDSPDVNAFATGARKNAALVAVSTGLLRSMNRAEAEAVMGHEVAHVANGDMVTMCLLQGVVNTFVIFFSRIIGSLISSLLARGESRSSSMGYFAGVMISQVLLGFLATMVVMFFSRYREFRADEGGADLAGKENMIAALARLKSAHAPESMPDQLAAFGISGVKAKFGKLFTSHPPLEQRIAALREYK